MRDQVIKVKESTETAASQQAAFTRRISMVIRSSGKVEPSPSDIARSSTLIFPTPKQEAYDATLERGSTINFEDITFGRRNSSIIIKKPVAQFASHKETFNRR